jgi:type I restriction enzyme S subunit
MGNNTIPNENWRKSQLGQLADFVNGRAFKPSDWTRAGIPIIRIQNLNGGAEFNYFAGLVEKRFSVQTGDLLFSWSGTRGTSFGPHFWRGPPGMLNQHIFNVRNLRGMEQKFLFYALSNITSAIEARAHGGTGIVHITKGQLEAFEVPLPPLSEQRKIAAILSSVDDVIEKTEEVIERVRVVKKAMMQELLTRGLPGRHTRFNKTELGEMPEEWEVLQLRDVCDFQVGFPFKSAEFSAEGDRLLRGSNVAPGQIDWATDKTRYFSRCRRSEVREYVLEPGDIVIGMDRPFVGAGFKIARIGECDLPALLLQRVGRFRELSARFDPDYLWVVARSSFIEGHLRVQQKGTDLPHISRDEILASLIPLPRIHEQREIGSAVATLDRRLLTECDSLAHHRLVKAALMSVLLTGELRFTPDTDAA